MKILKILGHPVMVITLFLLLLISGEHFGGFYLIYIFLGLPHGALHSIVAIAGMGITALGYGFRAAMKGVVQPVSSLVGISFMVAALFIFFINSKGYNDGTFHQTVPLISFTFFGISVLCNGLVSMVQLLGARPKDPKSLNIVS